MRRLHVFGGIALFVAAIGLFGLMSYNVSRRTREIGIRMAMGAEREAVLGLILRESMLLVVGGIVIGIAAALGVGRLIASQLFGLEPTDPATMALAIAVMCGRFRGRGLSACEPRHTRGSDDLAQVRIDKFAH